MTALLVIVAILAWQFVFDLGVLLILRRMEAQNVH